MKKITIAAFFMLAVCASACKKNHEIETPANTSASDKQLIPEELKPHVNYLSQAYGVNASDITYRAKDSTFIMQGDMAVARVAAELEMKEVKPASDSKLTTHQRQFAHLVSSSYTTTVRVMNNCTSPDWRVAASAAIANFNHNSIKAVSWIRFVEVTSGAYDVSIYETGTTSIYLAEGQLPYQSGSYRPGSYVRIYSNANWETLDKKKLIVTHELGHTIGFQHTNSTDGQPVNSTPSIDEWSFMNSPDGGNNSNLYGFNGFSNWDIIAFNNTYGISVQGWGLLPGSLMNISAGNSGHVYATEYNAQPDGNHLFRKWNGTAWTTQPSYAGSGVKLAVGDGGVYWFLTADHKIFRGAIFPAPEQLPGEAIDIAVNSSNELYIVSNTYLNSDGNMIMKWDGTNWVQFTTQGAKKIAVTPNGDVIITTNSGGVGFYKQSVGYWYIDNSVNASNIAVCNSRLDPAGSPILFIINSNTTFPSGDHSILKWTGNPGDWYGLSGGGVSIAVDDGGHPFITNNAGTVYWHAKF